MMVIIEKKENNLSKNTFLLFKSTKFFFYNK
jgi:hypothetical protein